MGALETGVFQGRVVGRISGILIFRTIVDYKVAMARELTFGGNGMAMSEKEFVNLTLRR